MWNIDFKKGPVYMQVADQVINKIARGEWLPGEKLPSARELASQASINPNTVVSAFAELERRDIIEKRRGLGTFVKESANVGSLKLNLLREINQSYLKQIHDLGISPEVAIKKLEEERRNDS